jgi:HEAT repeat protein
MRWFMLIILGSLMVALNQLDPVLAQSKKVMELIKDLKDKDPKVRMRAADELGRVAEVRLNDAKAALPALKAAQRDPDAGVRKAVLEAIGAIDAEPKTYVPILIDALKKDKDAAVRLSAVTALGQIGTAAKPAIPALLEVQKSAIVPPDKDAMGLRKAILDVVGKIDPAPKTYMPFLIDALKRDKDPTVLLAAVKALGELGPSAKAALPALQEVQKSAKLFKDKDMGLSKATEDALRKFQEMK